VKSNKFYFHSFSFFSFFGFAVKYSARSAMRACGRYARHSGRVLNGLQITQINTDYGARDLRVARACGRYARHSGRALNGPQITQITQINADYGDIVYRKWYRKI
jgi:hypothetical protein